MDELRVFVDINDDTLDKVIICRENAEKLGLKNGDSVEVENPDIGFIVVEVDQAVALGIVAKMRVLVVPAGSYPGHPHPPALGDISAVESAAALGMIPVEAVELLGLRKVKIGSHIGFPRDEE